LKVTIAVLGGIVLFSLLTFWAIRWLGKREPYGTFLRMRTRYKLRFFRLLLRDEDGKIPWYVKVIPVVLVIYLAIPFDIIPDFVPVLGYLDDVAIALFALVLVMKLTPRQVVMEVLRRAQEDGPATEESGMP
jgi:uncharacterized membrane protein YkvA (DUF1232 family)